MCMYCMVGDWQFRHDPPWPNNPPFPTSPYIPAPVVPPQKPWDLEKLVEFYDLIRRVKELEDKLGCPCEPNKADYLSLLK
jgi:hypothetical protein